MLGSVIDMISLISWNVR